MKRVTFRSAVVSIALFCVIILILSGEDCDVCYSPGVMALKFVACGFVIIIGSFHFRKEFKEYEKIIFDVESQPTLETSEASAGVPFSGHGIIQAEDGKLLISPYGEVQCVYYHSIKEKYVKRGKNSEWVMVENISRFVPFHLQDERGVLNIDLANMDDDFSDYRIDFGGRLTSNPKYSEIDCKKIFNKLEERSAEVKKFLGIPLISGGLYRKTECVLVPGTKVFVYGMAVKSPDGQLALQESEKCPLIISQKDRDDYVEEFYKGSSLIYLSHLMIAFGYTAILFSANYLSWISLVLLFPLLAIGNFLILGSLLFTAYNRIITVKYRALNALSNIDVELKRRAELIPNLVEAIKGYAEHEEQVQQFVAEARAQTVFSDKMPASNSPVIGSLSAMIESYPELKASENFQALMLSLVDTEQRIACSREFYNRNVRKYNTLISQFPFLLIAAPLGMKTMGYLSIGKGKDSVPQISF